MIEWFRCESRKNRWIAVAPKSLGSVTFCNDVADNADTWQFARKCAERRSRSSLRSGGETRCRKNLFVPFSWETSRKKTWMALQRIDSSLFTHSRILFISPLHVVLVSMDTNRIWYGNMTAPIPAKWHYATGTFALVCLFCGLISNGCVIVMFLRWVRRAHWDILGQRHFPRNSSLRRPKNYFIINLAICDIGLLLTNNSMHVIASYKTEWPFGQLGQWRSSDSFSVWAKWLVFEPLLIDF